MTILYVVIRRLPSKWGISTLLYMAVAEILIEAFAVSCGQRGDPPGAGRPDKYSQLLTTLL